MQAPASPRYAAVFREASGLPAVGAVVVEGDGLLFLGRQAGERFELRLSYGELTQVRIGRSAHERINGHATLVLARRNRSDLHVAPFGAGLLHELADLLSMLAARHAGDTEQATLRVPLRSGSRERVRELIAQGPPFDPAALGLERHQVFVGPEEAVFVLEGAHVHEKLARTMSEPRFWRAGVAWRGALAGRPRLAATPPAGCELVYSWERS